MMVCKVYIIIKFVVVFVKDVDGFFFVNVIGFFYIDGFVLFFYLVYFDNFVILKNRDLCMEMFIVFIERFCI